ncbi:MAG: phosphotransferase [Amaricoccus sp.]|uniref:aminoglycoside phosphotransferase family protein n=1 Tax=Amaricoccus sp. TaxID=1872485 RepID=UPI0039E25855
MSRDAEIAGFLAAAGWGAAVRQPLAGDASARRYERLHRGAAPAILMDVPPASGLAVGPFLAVDRWLRAAGLSAPEVFAADEAGGLVLLEDLGDDLFARICAAQPEREAGLYAAAVDLLADLQALPPPAGAWSPPPYDLAFLLREAGLMLEWYLPASAGSAASPDLVAEFQALATAALAPVALQTTAVYRDFHAENLLWLPGRAGHARVGLLDFQDMLIGHPAYDLVSLLADARRDVAPDLARAMEARYIDRTGADRESFTAAARVLSAQRNMKIMGLFTRLCRRDGKARYVDLLPRVWGYLAADLAHPGLAPLAAFVGRHLPAPEPGVRARIAA